MIPRKLASGSRTRMVLLALSSNWKGCGVLQRMQIGTENMGGEDNHHQINVILGRIGGDEAASEQKQPESA